MPMHKRTIDCAVFKILRSQYPVTVTNCTLPHLIVVVDQIANFVITNPHVHLIKIGERPKNTSTPF